MRSAALLAVCLASLALSCRMDCGAGTAGVGCESSSSGDVQCRSDTDCGPGNFCNFVAEPCPHSDGGAIQTSRIKSSKCERTPTDTRGKSCSSSDECAPDEDCRSGLCSAFEPCVVLACSSGCAITREPHQRCAACICDC